MNKIVEIAHWILDEQIKKKGRPHHGATVLKRDDPSGYEVRMGMYVSIAVQLMAQRFASSSADSAAGTAKLTELSLAIGNNIANHMEVKTTSKYDLLPLGDLILSGFLNNDCIDIKRNESYSEFNSDAPYEVIIKENFYELTEVIEKDKALLLRGTSIAPINKISKMIQGHGRSVIKNYTEFFETEYNEFLEESIEQDLPWLQAVNKLQSQGWKINSPVLNIIIANQDKLRVDVKKGTGLGCPVRVEKAREALRKSNTQARKNKLDHESKLWNEDRAYLSALSKNMETNLIITKANLLELSPRFYQYVEVDYRGRMYYQEPLMNFQGPDIARGLMLFANGKPFTDDGLKWLAIHLSLIHI